ncbi:MAG: hypothetical protein IRZ18_09770 [Clostridia bacterium]|nr:hypothetical protein [Clostridia bacterium]
MRIGLGAGTRWFAAESGGAGGAEGVIVRRRGPRRGFKHWTRSEDERLRQVVLSTLGRLGTLQAVAEECHPAFNRDAGSVLRRIRHLRRADAEFDAAVMARLRRARRVLGAGAEDAFETAGGAPEVGGGETAAPAVPAFRARPSEASTAAGDELIAAFLEANSGPLDARQRERLALLAERYGQVPVMAALAESLLHRADVILADVERRLSR